MSDEITLYQAMNRLRREYRDTVNAACDDLIDDARTEFDGGRGLTGDNLREWLMERVWEYVDSHGDVLYTARATMVVMVSDNDGYTLENFGSEGVVENGALNWSKLAFGALYADILEELDNRLEGGINDADEWFTADDETDE